MHEGQIPLAAFIYKSTSLAFQRPILPSTCRRFFLAVLQKKSSSKFVFFLLAAAFFSTASFKSFRIAGSLDLTWLRRFVVYKFTPLLPINPPPQKTGVA
jgi:hypothetical protein